MEHLGTRLPTTLDDGVTVLRFARDADALLVASWDAHLRLYDISAMECRVSLKLSTPILDCNFRGAGALSGGLDGQVLSHDFESEVPPILLGSHQKPIKTVEFCEEKGLVVSGGWDRLVKFWDPRRAHHRMPVTSFELPATVYSAAQTNSRLVVATSEKHVFIFDTRNLDAGPVHRETGLQHQTRCVRCFGTGEGYGVTSIEGRVAVDYFEPQSAAKKYSFRCHRKKDEGGQEVIYPVNAIAFHPSQDTFATGGCDGSVAVWDGGYKKKISSITGVLGYSYPTSVASLEFNRDGSLLAVASSYTFEFGEKPDAPNEIYIRKMSPEDLRARVR